MASNRNFKRFNLGRLLQVPTHRQLWEMICNQFLTGSIPHSSASFLLVSRVTWKLFRGQISSTIFANPNFQGSRRAQQVFFYKGPPTNRSVSLASFLEFPDQDTAKKFLDAFNGLSSPLKLPNGNVIAVKRAISEINARRNIFCAKPQK